MFPLFTTFGVMRSIDPRPKCGGEKPHKGRKPGCYKAVKRWTLMKRTNMNVCAAFLNYSVFHNFVYC